MLSHFQDSQARKKTGEPKGHYSGRTSEVGLEDENPPPVDVDLKKGHKGVNRIYRRIMSESSDDDVAITKNVRKESRPITISDKVWFFIIVKRDACGPRV